MIKYNIATKNGGGINAKYSAVLTGAKIYNNAAAVGDDVAIDTGAQVDPFILPETGDDWVLEKKTPDGETINDCEDLPRGILDHCHRIMPGLGVITVAEVSEAVKAVGYDGPACLELFRPEYWDMDAEDVIRMGAELTRKFL